MATISTPLGNVEYTSEVGVHSTFYVNATLWQKGDECRVYFTVSTKKGKEQCGHYDCKRKMKCCKSSPAIWGHQINDSIIHTSLPPKESQNYTDQVLGGVDVEA